jgi:hypothetical protein
MPPIVHPGRLLKRELLARGLGANRLALDLGVPSGRITDNPAFAAELGDGPWPGARPSGATGQTRRLDRGSQQAYFLTRRFHV